MTNKKGSSGNSEPENDLVLQQTEVIGNDNRETD